MEWFLLNLNNAHCLEKPWDADTSHSQSLLTKWMLYVESKKQYIIQLCYILWIAREKKGSALHTLRYVHTVGEFN